MADDAADSIARVDSIAAAQTLEAEEEKNSTLSVDDGEKKDGEEKKEEDVTIS